jgi:hypothetical protein
LVGGAPLSASSSPLFVVSFPDPSGKGPSLIVVKPDEETAAAVKTGIVFSISKPFDGLFEGLFFVAKSSFSEAKEVPNE